MPATAVGKVVASNGGTITPPIMVVSKFSELSRARRFRTGEEVDEEEEEEVDSSPLPPADGSSAAASFSCSSSAVWCFFSCAVSHSCWQHWEAVRRALG